MCWLTGKCDFPRLPRAGAIRQHQVPAEAKQAGCPRALCARRVSAESSRSPRESCFLSRLRRVPGYSPHTWGPASHWPFRSLVPHMSKSSRKSLTIPETSPPLRPPALVLPSEPGVPPLTAPAPPPSAHASPHISHSLSRHQCAEHLAVLPPSSTFSRQTPVLCAQNTLSIPCHRA